jgi:hypothetical protein
VCPFASQPACPYGKKHWYAAAHLIQLTDSNLASNMVMTYGAMPCYKVDTIEMLMSHITALHCACLSGVACRWAGSHQGPQDRTAELLKQYGVAAAAPVAEAAHGGEAGAANGAAAAGAQINGSSPATDVPVGILPMQPALNTQAPLNTLTKDVQQALWKNR